MKLSKQNFIELRDLAKKAAIEAGTLVEWYANKNLEVLEKNGGESRTSQVLTEADLKSQELILNLLHHSIEQYDLAILSEEQPDDGSRLSKDYFWCIDPLDGTLPFIEGVDGYSISIALVSAKGESVIGVIYNPRTKTLYEALKGMGTLKNEQAYSQQLKNKHLTLVTDRSFFNYPKHKEILLGLSHIAQGHNLKGVQIIEKGGGAMNAMWVIENSPAVYFKLPKKRDGGGSLWDFAASACIFTELGAVACNMYLKPLDLNNAHSTFMNKEGVMYATSAELARLVHQMIDTL